MWNTRTTLTSGSKVKEALWCFHMAVTRSIFLIVEPCLLHSTFLFILSVQFLCQDWYSGVKNLRYRNINCSPVWSNFTAYHYHNSLQILHNKLAWVLLHADIRTLIDKMLEELKWVTLDDRWKHQLLLVAFKCLRQMVPAYMPSFTFIHSTHDMSTRSHSSNTLVIPPWNITAGKRTFEYRAATLGNRLSVNIRSNFMNMSLNEFKSVI